MAVLETQYSTGRPPRKPAPPDKPSEFLSKAFSLGHQLLTATSLNNTALLRFSAKINNKPATILVDSGASTNFIDKDFVHQH